VVNTLYTLPCISAAIGWVTNYLAIKMLFHPKKPINLGLFTLQGIFPKRHEALAVKIGQLVANELISLDDLKGEIIGNNVNEKARAVVEEHLDNHLKDKVSDAFPMMAMFINDNIINQFKEMILKELDVVFPKLIESFTNDIESKIDIEKIVTEKVRNFSFVKLEEILVSIMKKEFKFIELIGAILGFIIGCIQVLIIEFSH